VSFLLDTNVVSEWVKPCPHPGVITWLAEADEDRVFLSVVTLAELRHGIERMAAGSRRARLDVNCRCASKSVCSLSTLRLPMCGGRLSPAARDKAGRSTPWTPFSPPLPRCTSLPWSLATSPTSDHWGESSSIPGNNSPGPQGRGGVFACRSDQLPNEWWLLRPSLQSRTGVSESGRPVCPRNCPRNCLRKFRRQTVAVTFRLGFLSLGFCPE
jgi:hypothetical protein